MFTAFSLIDSALKELC